MNTKDLLIQELKKSGLFLELVNFMDNEIPYSFRWGQIASLSLRQYAEKMETDNSQRTVVLSVKMSEIIKNFFIHRANEYLVEKGITNISVVDMTEPEDYFYGKSYDLIFLYNGQKVAFEVKFTQGHKFTGATHATKKVPDYLLLSFDIDKEIIIDYGSKFVKGIFVAITTISSEDWNGKASSNNSFTVLKLHEGNIDDSRILHGSINKRRKTKNLIFQNV